MIYDTYKYTYSFSPQANVQRRQNTVLRGRQCRLECAPLLTDKTVNSQPIVGR